MKQKKSPSAVGDGDFGKFCGMAGEVLTSEEGMRSSVGGHVLDIEPVYGMRSERELLHIGMAEVLKHPFWWNKTEPEVYRIVAMATKGALPQKQIVEEFRALRAARGLPEVRPST